MNILIVGDIIGRAGRQALAAYLPEVRARLELDFVVVNGENSAHGFGITDKICAEYYDLGVDAITTGNHVWDQRPIMNYIDGDARLLRPLNFPAGTPGKGAAVLNARNGRKVMVINAMCRLFMDPLDDPFQGVEDALKGQRLGDTANGATVDAILVDFHGEASSEKMSMGHVLDGRVSAVVGTHTHIPTADAQVLPGGTAYQTDLGMTGDYDSVIGMVKGPAAARFTTKLPQGRLEPAQGDATFCAVFVETDDTTGLARRIAPVRLGGRLAETCPA